MPTGARILTNKRSYRKLSRIYTLLKYVLDPYSVLSVVCYKAAFLVNYKGKFFQILFCSKVTVYSI
jgi:hypothetical protein